MPLCVIADGMFKVGRQAWVPTHCGEILYNQKLSAGLRVYERTYVPLVVRFSPTGSPDCYMELFRTPAAAMRNGDFRAVADSVITDWRIGNGPVIRDILPGAKHQGGIWQNLLTATPAV